MRLDLEVIERNLARGGIHVTAVSKAVDRLDRQLGDLDLEELSFFRRKMKELVRHPWFVHDQHVIDQIERQIKKRAGGRSRLRKAKLPVDSATRQSIDLSECLGDASRARRKYMELAGKRSLTSRETWFIEAYLNRYDPP